MNTTIDTHFFTTFGRRIILSLVVVLANLLFLDSPLVAQSPQMTGMTVQLQKKLQKTDIPRRDTAVFGINGCSRIVFTGPTMYHIANYQQATTVLHSFVTDFRKAVSGLDTTDYPLGATYFCVPNGKRQLKLQNPDYLGDKLSYNQELKYFLDSVPAICYQLHDIHNSINITIYLSAFKEFEIIDTFSQGKTWQHIFNDSIKYPLSIDSFLAKIKMVTNPGPLNHWMQRFRHPRYSDQIKFIPEVDSKLMGLDTAKMRTEPKFEYPYKGPGDIKGNSTILTAIGVNQVEFVTNFWPNGLSLNTITVANEYALGTTVELPIYRKYNNYVPISWWYAGISTYWSAKFLENKSGLLSSYNSTYQIGWMYIQNQGMEEPISLGFEVGYMPGKSKNIPDENVWIPNESLTLLIRSNRTKFQFSAGIICETQLLKYKRVNSDPNSKINGSGWAPVIRLSLPL